MPAGKRRTPLSTGSSAPRNQRPPRRAQETEQTDSSLQSILSDSPFALVSERLHTVGQALRKFCGTKYGEAQRIGSAQFFSFAWEAAGQGGLSLLSATSLFSLGEWARPLGLRLCYDSYSPGEQKENCGGSMASKLEYPIKTFAATLCTRVLLDPTVLADTLPSPGAQSHRRPRPLPLVPLRTLSTGVGC